MRLFKNLKNQPWANWAVAACIAVLFYVIITHLHIFGYALATVYHWVRPVITGIVISYVLDPLVRVYENTLFKRIKSQGLRRALATGVGILTVILFVALLMVLLIPQLIDSIRTFASNLGSYSTSFQSMMHQMENTLGRFNIDLSQAFGKIDETLMEIPAYITDNMSGIVGVTAGIGSGVADGLMAFIVAIYFLADKHRLMTILRRILHRMFSDDRYDRLGGYWRHCNDIFVRFIAYDLLDGVAVGVINAIFMLIAGIPYSVLISVVVGVTNLAPTVGPVIGALIGAVLLLLVKPWYALLFLIFTVVLQTVDGYILKPRLFGGALGVPGIWILVTLIIGGRMFGVAGILLAVPVAAIIMFICQEFFPNLYTDEEAGGSGGKLPVKEQTDAGEGKT